MLRRVNHVKKNVLAHGQFTEWIENKNWYPLQGG